MFTFLLNKKSRYCILTENMKNKKKEITNRQAFTALGTIQQYLKLLQNV